MKSSDFSLTNYSVRTFFSLLFTMLSLFTVLSLPEKVQKFSCRREKKWTTWLVETWKCEKKREFQFRFEIFRSWVIKFILRNWISFRQLVHKISEILFIFWQYYSDFRGYFREAFRVKNFWFGHLITLHSFIWLDLNMTLQNFWN